MAGSTALPMHTQDTPDISVILVTYNTANLLPRLFNSIEASRGALTLQVIVVDNASRDNSVEVVRSLPLNSEIIENDGNVGFARANNQALALARGRYVLLLNTDAFVAPDTLSKTVKFMDDTPTCGVLGVKLVGEDGSLQPSCRFFPTPWNNFLFSTGASRFFPKAELVDDLAWDHASVRECDWVPGCYYLIRQEVIRQIGLFDPRYFLYCEEVDHCRAVKRAGWKVMFYPFTQVIHLGGESALSEGPVDSGKQISELHIESELLYFRKHHGLFGVLLAAGLSIFADVLKAIKRALVRSKGASTTVRHARIVLDRLFATRLGAQATR